MAESPQFRAEFTKAHGSNKKILLVHDSVTALLMEKTILKESSDFILISAWNGEEAVQIAMQEKPDLVLIDVVMPRINGVETCRAIRSSPEISEVPIIYLVTRDGDDPVGAYASGCTAYINKPLKPAELIALVEAHMATAK